VTTVAGITSGVIVQNPKGNLQGAKIIQSIKRSDKGVTETNIT
jgi:hypothetical protein